MIYVVYHCYLVGEWKKIVLNQLNRLKRSKLYDAADSIFVTVNLGDYSEEEFNNLTRDYKKLNKFFFKNNEAEYPAIKKVREVGQEKDSKIFYFHAKGVSNTYIRYNTLQKSNDKINNISAWRECLEYFLIDRWKESLEKLKEFDNVGVTCNNGWYWGNFWWTKHEHIIKTKSLEKGSRWYYEAWLNDGVDSKNYEWYKFTYNPYLTHMHADWYKSKPSGQKIIIHKALYGCPSYEIDEGYSGAVLDKNKDVTQIVKELLEKENNKKLNFNVSNETLGGDPIPMNRKFLMLEFSSEHGKKIYKMGVHEGMHLEFEL